MYFNPIAMLHLFAEECEKTTLITFCCSNSEATIDKTKVGNLHR